MNCISFSEGDKNIIKKLTELRETNKILVVFIDVMPDNIKTVECYNKCIKWVDSGEVECYVIPIPCIEYYVIKAFYKESLVKNVVIDFMNYKDYIYDDNHRLLSNKSFEKFCKSVIKKIILSVLMIIRSIDSIVCVIVIIKILKYVKVYVDTRKLGI